MRRAVIVYGIVRRALTEVSGGSHLDEERERRDRVVRFKFVSAWGLLTLSGDRARWPPRGLLPFGAAQDAVGTHELSTCLLEINVMRLVRRKDNRGVAFCRRAFCVVSGMLVLK